MKQIDKPTFDKSLLGLTGIHFAKKSMEAYHHAKDIVEKDSPIAKEICQTCAQICHDCVQDLKEMEDNELDEVIEICLANALLCEQLIKSFEN
ncbi:hypothetical protein GCM10010954_10750 [Halobacillus andaensis]|uniref:Uncharacterized protein n=1 Tax=Halobacillus andaensis TaxID=1176239 RepID=A0A917B141_HALAA|nr:hypothetical protein [Halobacillus andaensis]MBP2003866.1 gamma-glutamyl:cysteine ligase YbdK (ATP-grasp superfamily) [Halobacillus andaensis]GGF13839.1 hypothetical protein GCM10010954_10750 [Halobacillus andaensis]